MLEGFCGCTAVCKWVVCSGDKFKPKLVLKLIKTLRNGAFVFAMEVVAVKANF